MMDSQESDEETEQQRDSQFMGAASIISTEGKGGGWREEGERKCVRGSSAGGREGRSVRG